MNANMRTVSVAKTAGTRNIPCRTRTGRFMASKVPALVEALEQGNAEALNELLPEVYDELIYLARQQRRSWHGELTLNTTALVHEVYLKVVGQQRLAATTRAHFLGVAVKAMRHVLCNHARDRNRQKRGGGVAHVRIEPGYELAAEIELSSEQSESLVALDEALAALEQVSDRQARVVECRFFGGLSVEDTAAVLGVSPRTVKRDWTFARAWLKRDMQHRIA